MSHQEQISQALSGLLQRSNEDAFVILEDTKTKKYVQFAGSTREPLILNIPFIAFTPLELERAKKLFEEYKIKSEETPVSDYKGGPVTGKLSQFNMNLGNDIKRATEIALRIFSEVYMLPPDFKLGVEEN